MTRKLLTGNAAAALGARLAEADYIPAFPITPQTEIIETLAEWINSGEMKGRLTMYESEHSMITAAGSAACSGVRVFTATSSQGLMYGMEMIYSAAGWRAPFVMVNVSRGLASPTTLECDHNDILAARDSGCIQIHCASCQEIVDSVIMAYRIAEDRDIRVPVIVNFDGFYLSFTREPVQIPSQEIVKKYLPAFKKFDTGFSASDPQSRAVIVLGGSQYSYFRYQLHLAVMNGVKIYQKAADEFARCFGRAYSPVETYKTDDAAVCFFMIGSFSTKAKDAVDRLRSSGMKIGLIRPRLIRPFPETALRMAFSGIRGAAVIDQNISMGKGGILYMELASVLYSSRKDAPVLLSYIGGLGGRDITFDEFAAMAEETMQAVKSGEVPEPRLLYNEDEMKQMKKLQDIAGVVE